MSSASHQKAYQEFQVLLTEFKENFKNHEPKFPRVSITKRFQQLQQWFERNIVSLSEENLARAIAPRWQAIQRELIREFRLLATDVIFLASSRQPATKEARLKGIDDRLDKLVNFCQTAIEIVPDEQQ
ncbi:heterocyst frequency control protein PatD [Myxosarcina sp. GI1(2024)]